VPDFAEVLLLDCAGTEGFDGLTKIDARRIMEMMRKV